MRVYAIILFGMGLSGCMQSGQPTGSLAQSETMSAEEMQNLSPIYTPLVDLNRKSKAKFAHDHAECRQMAEPQERVARAAASQQQSGAVLQTVGTLASALPVPGLSSASSLATVTSVAQNAGSSMQQSGASQQAMAMQDYMLVVNTCLVRRGYVLLRT